MAKQTGRHAIKDGLHIYKQANSEYWYARFIVEGTWYVKATKEKTKKKAIPKAMELQIQYRMRADENLPMHQTRRAKQYLFPEVANLAIQRMKVMESEGTGKSIFKGYILILNKYHKEFFAKTAIMDIDQILLRKFDSWRTEKLGRNPANSTILDHNSAFNRVFDEAVARGYMVTTQRPSLGNTGTVGQRRASFTEEEIKRLIMAACHFIVEARTEKSKMIRELLVPYITLAANTGLRPGTEMDNIKWGDISIYREDELLTFYITISKGKTTAYTGSRKIVCREEALEAFIELRDTFPDRKPSDKIFLLSDGSETKQLGKTFTKLLKKTNMETSSEGKRTLYSLRHSYITSQLKQEVPAQVLAIQCGTSIQMLESHYSHAKPEMFTGLLAGVAFSNPVKKLSQRLDPSIDQETIDITNKFIDEWEAEYANRGCI